MIKQTKIGDCIEYQCVFLHSCGHQGRFAVIGKAGYTAKLKEEIRSAKRKMCPSCTIHHLLTFGGIK